MKLEKDVEKYFREQVKKHGGLALKFTSPGTRGVPDRIVLYKGETIFVELKRPGGKLRADQIKTLGVFSRQLIPIYIIDTKEKVDHFVTKTMPNYN